MSLTEYADALHPKLLSAIERKGFTELTAVQRVVLDPALTGRDLRITSQTGSGKTLAIGLTLRSLPWGDTAAQKGVAQPLAIVIAPTRELAQQIERELAWLYADSGVHVACTTGGASYHVEQRALGRGPGIVVGTPGRLLDHLGRGTIAATQVGALVLDEADRMLELGFREDLEAIFGRMPEDKQTHLVSATFPRALRALADSVQRQPSHVEGSVLGAANVDIDHVIHIVHPTQRGDAIINLLLAQPDDQTLIFVRTRADAGDLAGMLSRSGFAASGLSGDMEQAARNRALAGFRNGDLRVLVATDVAARGIDVQDVTRVLHAELPRDPDAYTHRSGRTGRAGRKGVSALLVAPAQVVHATRLLRNLGVAHRCVPVPTPEEITRAQDDRLFAQLTAADAADPAVDPTACAALAERLVQHGSLERTLARLLALQQSGARPRQIRTFSERAPSQERRPAAVAGGRDREFVPFRVSWGKQRGADARRLLAMVCRRGHVQGRDVGPIRVDRTFSTVGIDSSVAEAFERHASQPDPQDPSIQIRRDASHASQPVAQIGAGRVRRPTHRGRTQRDSTPREPALGFTTRAR
jgi:ATP-dependent RNA helicase DeaD